MFWIALAVTVGCSVLFVRWFNRKSNHGGTYRYGYLPYPFASRKEMQIFTINAESQKEADALAQEEMARRLAARMTTMTECYALG